jgi:hypothetical protein
VNEPNFLVSARALMSGWRAASDVIADSESGTAAW